MLFTFFSYLITNFCSLIAYDKSLNVKTKKADIIVYGLLSMFSGAVCLAISKAFSHREYIKIVYLVLSMGIFHRIYKKPCARNYVEATVLSLGIGYVLNYATWFLCSVMAVLMIYSGVPYVDTIILPIWFLLEMLAVWGLFRIKRFRKGFSFLQKMSSSAVEMLLCLMIFVFLSAANKYSDSDVIIIESLVVVSVLSVFLFIWWRKSLTNVYIERQLSKELEYNEAIVSEKDRQIIRLTENNDALAAIIHKDNKLIPALKMSVEKLMKNSDDEEIKELLRQIEELSSDRTVAVEDYTSASENLEKFGSVLIDSMLGFMCKKADDGGCRFRVRINHEAKAVLKKSISEKDICTIVADMCENAIIATKACEVKNILVDFSVESGVARITFMDSGKPFEKKVIDSLGKRRITSHGDEGGSGIGLFTVFQLLRKSASSFEITEFLRSENFTKAVSVVFDSRNQFRVNTEKVFESYEKRTSAVAV